MATIIEAGDYIKGRTDVEKNTLQYPGLQMGLLGEAMIFSDKLEMLPGVTGIRKAMVGDGFYDVAIEVMSPTGNWFISVFVCDPTDLLEVARELSVTMSTETRLVFCARILAWWDNGDVKHPLVDLNHFYSGMDFQWSDYTRVLFTGR